MVIFLRRDGDTIYVCDKEMWKENRSMIGHPEIQFSMKETLESCMTEFCQRLGIKEEHKSYKMVLKNWPIE